MKYRHITVCLNLKLDVNTKITTNNNNINKQHNYKQVFNIVNFYFCILGPGKVGAGKWGDYRHCDLSPDLVENLFQHLATIKDQVIWTAVAN